MNAPKVNFSVGATARKLWFPCCLSLLVLVHFSCDPTTDNLPDSKESFDRKAMLQNWADQIIIPSYEHYHSKVTVLDQSAEQFAASPSVEKLADLRSTWKDAYLAWQWVSMFEIGKAEAINFRNFTNIFPTNTEGIEENIKSGSYNLQLPSKFAEQGLPALDYMINGLGENDGDIVKMLGMVAYSDYLTDLTSRLSDLSNEVLSDWKDGGFRDRYVENNGSSATSSVDKTVNDFMYDYEKFLRAGKVGIPAGVFSGSPIPKAVEARFSPGFSKELFLENLQVVQDFFNGKAFGKSGAGASLKSYLDHLGSEKDGSKLSDLINAQFDKSRETSVAVDSDFAKQIQQDNSQMLKLYDELQENVVLIKVDMMQALNIAVDYVDADGD